MAAWLGIAIFAQFLFAVSLLIDRHIVKRAQHIGAPVVYAFYTAFLSGFVVVLLPFNVVTWPQELVLIHSLLYAAAFVTGIYFLYSALTVARASDAAPVVGAVSAITSLILAGLLLEGDISSAFVLPVLVLAAGTALISHFHLTRRVVLYTMCSGAALGASVFLFKLVVNEIPFLDGFFWTRIMSVAAALSLLVVPQLRRVILKGGRRSSHRAKLLVLGNKINAGVASALTAFAISLGSVAVVNALAGLQFVFLFLFALLFAKHMPLTSAAKTGDHGGWQTGLGVALIVAGLAALFLV